MKLGKNSCKSLQFQEQNKSKNNKKNHKLKMEKLQ